LARTEIIHAHAEGQLDAFELLKVEGVQVLAEWSTAGDEIVCELCSDLEGVVMTIKEARGSLPRHPNCRCAWVPADKKLIESGQKRGKAKDLAVRESIQAEKPKLPFGVAKARSSWLGKTRLKAAKKSVTKKSIKAARVGVKPIKSKGVHEDYTKRIDKQINKLAKKYPKASQRLKGVEVPDWKVWKKACGEGIGSTDCWAVVDPISKSKDIIYLNPEYFGINAKWEINKTLLKSYKSKWTAIKDIEGLISHEFGHVVSNVNKKGMDDLLHWWIYDRDLKYERIIQKQLGKYSLFTHQEQFAESFAQGISSIKTSEIAKKTLKIVGVKV
jgi:hypothetical protein